MSIKETALNYVGKVRYAFGADDIKNGVGDCSSFTQEVFKQNGYSIGRDTKAQYSKGISVDKNSLKEGDLVFFQNTYRDGVSHVGIYIGNGEFVQNGGNGVTVENLDSDYWKNHWLGAKRVTAAEGNYNRDGELIKHVGGVTTGLTNDDNTKLDVIGQTVRFFIIIGLVILAVVLFLNAIGTTPQNAKNKIKKKVLKNGE